jgi:endonuclease-8
MPEGPEARRQADRVGAAVAGHIATKVRFGLSRLEPEAPELEGRRVENVESRGKALLIHFEGGRTVYAHSQLYGRWRVVKPGALPKTNRQLRFAVETDKKWALLYSASDIEVLPSAELDRHPFLASLGPDALDETVTREDILARLEDARFRRRQIGHLLLEQGFVAGLGNYLRSEILFFAGILPERKPKDLRPRERAHLAEAILDVPRRAYRLGGITVEDELNRRLKADGVPKRRRRHHVFGRSSATCRRCDTPIERREVASRRVYICPSCQS